MIFSSDVKGTTYYARLVYLLVVVFKVGVRDDRGGGFGGGAGGGGGG